MNGYKILYGEMRADTGEMKMTVTERRRRADRGQCNPQHFLDPSTMRAFLVLLTSLCCVSACKTNAITGRSQLLLVPESQAISASKQAYMQTLAPLEKEGKVNNDPALTRRVQAV